MECREQLEKWVAGESIHNNERDECCPDFSCCDPELLAPREIREKVLAAYNAKDQSTMHAILGMFLTALIKKSGAKDVYVAGHEEGSA